MKANDDDKKVADTAQHIATTTLYSREQARDMLAMARVAGLPPDVTMGVINRAYGALDLATACDICMGTLKGFSLGGDP
jgi:hypothetical protein